MGVIYNSIPGAVVTLSATVPNAVSPAVSSPTGRTGVCKCYYKVPTGNTWYDLYTPTAGKIFYVTEISVCGDGAGIVRFGDNASGNADGGSAVLDGVMVMTNASRQADVPFPVPLKVATKLNVACNNTTPLFITVSGWEE